MIRRRTFLSGMLSLAALPVPGLLFLESPRIWGDGAHDDAAGLQALFDGEPFVTENIAIQDGVKGGSVVIKNGVFRLDNCLKIKGGCECLIFNTSFVRGDFDGDMIYMDGDSSHKTINCRVLQ